LNNDKEKIREVFEEVYAANVRSGDLQGYASMYSEDALWMPPDAPDRRGVEDILEAFEMQVAKQDTDPTFTAEEIEVMGDFGYVIGTSLATIHPKNAKGDSASNEIRKKFRAVWLMKKEDDIWKIDRQIWNSKPLD